MSAGTRGDYNERQQTLPWRQANRSVPEQVSQSTCPRTNTVDASGVHDVEVPWGWVRTEEGFRICIDGSNGVHFELGIESHSGQLRYTENVS